MASVTLLRACDTSLFSISDKTFGPRKACLRQLKLSKKAPIGTPTRGIPVHQVLSRGDFSVSASNARDFTTGTDFNIELDTSNVFQSSSPYTSGEDLFSLVRQMQLETERSISRDMEEMSKEMKQLREEAARSDQPYYSRSFEQASEGPYGVTRSYSSVTIYSSGSGYSQMQPQSQGPGFLAIFLPVLALSIYLGGIFKLVQNYSRTRYAENKKWILALVWPFLFAFSKRFRDEFKRAQASSSLSSK